MAKSTIIYLLVLALASITRDIPLGQAQGFALTSLSEFEPAKLPSSKRYHETANSSEPKTDPFFKQPDYPEDGPRRRDRGTGSRGNCNPGDSSIAERLTLTPLIPTDGWGLTVSESPTLWIQIAYKSEPIQHRLSGTLSVEAAETSQKLLPKAIPVALPHTSGIFRVPLPHSLTVNQWYRWYLILDCHTVGNVSRTPVLWIEGLVKRVELAPGQPQVELAPGQRQQDALTSQTQIAFYADQGIWYDAINEAQKNRCQTPRTSDQEDLWNTLLTDIGLEKITQISCSAIR